MIRLVQFLLCLLMLALAAYLHGLRDGRREAHPPDWEKWEREDEL